MGPVVNTFVGDFGRIFAAGESMLATRWVALVTAVGEYIKQRRLDLGLTIGQVSTKSGVAVSTISLIEDGKRHPRPDTLAKLAPALRVPYQHLMRLAGYLPTEEPAHVEPRHYVDLSRVPVHRRRALIRTIETLIRESEQEDQDSE